MFQSGLIRPSISPFASPVVLAKKSDGSWCVCIDYKSLNQHTINDKIPISLIDDLLDELNSATYFSKLDADSGYHQVRVAESDIAKPAFKTHNGLYDYAFWFTNALSTFQNLMNDIFRQYLRRFVLVCFGNFLVYSKDWEVHLQPLSLVLETLRHNQLYTKFSKSRFGSQQLGYLRYIIIPNGITVDNKKIDAIAQWPIPATPKALREIFGLTGYGSTFEWNCKIEGFQIVWQVHEIFCQTQRSTHVSTCS